MTYLAWSSPRHPFMNPSPHPAQPSELSWTVPTGMPSCSRHTRLRTHRTPTQLGLFACSYTYLLPGLCKIAACWPRQVRFRIAPPDLRTFVRTLKTFPISTALVGLDADVPRRGFSDMGPEVHWHDSRIPAQSVYCHC